MSTARGAAEHLPRSTLLRLLAVLAIVVAPHTMRLPVWESAMIVLLGGWRLFAALRGWRMPPMPVKVALTVAAFTGVFLSYGRVTGQHAGIALLVSMLVLKLTELRARRDVMVLVFMMYFILVTHFLYSQAIWTIVWLFGATIAITAVLIDVNHAGGPLPWRRGLRLSATMTAQALPLMVLMFLLFPRLPGPLWGTPADASVGRTGLSDSMSPGDIAQLMRSDEPAFRVRFLGPEPAQDALYWRGPVLTAFDGRRWEQRYAGALPEDDDSRFFGTPYRYEMVLEPTRTHWLLGLDITRPGSQPEDARLAADFQLLAARVVSDRRLYRATAHTEYRMQPGALPAWVRSANLRLPDDGNPRSRELAERWRAAASSPRGIVDAALTMFREQPFFYTLEPPPLGSEAIDQFLFDTRRGFCEHYASAFTVLMRAAGLPARVVTGYHGGSRNAFGDYFLVRQSDAHAWSEVWLGDAGWVRVDPTQAIHPSRIEDTAAQTRIDYDADAIVGGTLGWERLRYLLEARRDQISAVWDRWVLGYGQETQRELFGRFGLEGWRNLMIALTITVSGVIAVLGLLLLRGSRPPPVREPAQREWRRLQQRLRRLGFEQRSDEGPQDFTRRVGAARPALAPALDEATRLYLRIRYAGDALPSSQRRLRAAVSAVTR